MVDLFQRRFGCGCDSCPFRAERRGPVDDELVGARFGGFASVVIVIGAPSGREVRAGSPSVGFRARFLADVDGIERASIIYSTSCQEPELGEGDRWESASDWLYRFRGAISKGRITSPLAACRPRLERRLARADVVITLGSLALRAVAESESVRVGKLRRKLDQATIVPLEKGQRGHPFVLPSGRVLMPTLDPAECERGRRHMLHVVRDDMERALRWKRAR